MQKRKKRVTGADEVFLRPIRARLFFFVLLFLFFHKTIMIRRCFSSSGPLSKVYEYRTYAVQPQHFPSFLALTNEKISLRMEHSKLLGYWTTEIGGVNEVVHLWEYDSLAHRQGVRVGLGQAESWNKEYMNVMRPMLVSQQNILLSQVSQKVEDSSSSDGGIYLVGSMKEACPEDENLVGLFKSTCGDVTGTNYLGLWRYQGMDQVDETNAVDKANFQWSKLVLPCAFSPLK